MATYYILRFTLPQDARNPGFDILTMLTPLIMTGVSYSATLVAGSYGYNTAYVNLRYGSQMEILGGPGTGLTVHAAIDSSATEVGGNITMTGPVGLAVDMTIVLIMRAAGRPTSTLPVGTLPAGSLSSSFNVPIKNTADAAGFTMAEVLAFFAEQQGTAS